MCMRELATERERREKAEREFEDLKLTLKIVEFQLSIFQGHQMRQIAARRMAALEYYRREYANAHPGCENIRFIGRGGLTEGTDEID